MRTTLTLDADVIAKLRLEARKTGRAFKELVNSFLRIGLNSQHTLKSRKRFKIKAFNLGVHAGLNYDNIGELLEQIEGPRHR